MLSPRSRRSIDSLSPTSPNITRGQFYPRAGAGRFQTQRGSVGSSACGTIGSTLDTAAQWNGLAEFGRNSISTLLQSPIVRSGSVAQTTLPASSIYKAPTTRDIPPVTLSPIPEYDLADLKQYMSQVGALCSALGQIKDTDEEESTPSRSSSRSGSVPDYSEQTRRLSSWSYNSRQTSITSMSPIESPRRRSAAGRRAAQTLAPLSTVPNVFFEEDFHLENPRTFDIVSEHSELVRPIQAKTDEYKNSKSIANNPRKVLASNAILQEKLSWYMDTIEIHLVNSISSASKSFFVALSSLRELHQETTMSVDRIKMLRKDLLSLDEDLAIGGLKIISMKQRRENLKRLSDAVLQLQNIVELIAKCNSLIEEEEPEKALDSIDSLENLVSGEVMSNNRNRSIRDLRGAVSLKNINNDIDTLRYRIGKIFEIRFSTSLMNDLRQYVESSSVTETLQRWGFSLQRSRGHHREHSSPAYLTVKVEFRTELSTLLNSLYRARHISQATIVYRESVLREIRDIIRRQLPTSSDDDAESMTSASTAGKSQHRTHQERISMLARNLRSMEPKQGEDLLKNIYIGIGEALRRIGMQGKVLLDITSTFRGNSSSQSPDFRHSDEHPNKGSSKTIISRETQDEMHHSLNMSDLVGQAVDIAQDKVIKLLRVRSDQTICLSVESFLRYFTLNFLFANECEAVSGRSGTSLKNLVNGQIKDFTRQLGESQRQSLATGMEADSWNAKDFTEIENELLSHIISSSTQDVKDWTAGCYVWISKPSNANLDIEGNEKNETRDTPFPSKVSIRSAVIESESYILPNSAILCLHGLSSFLHLNTGIPSMTTEIATTMLSYLTLFNSRCTQLILGAGATRSAGLKNITTKHLALASQSLSFISTLITHVREFVRRHSSSSNLMLLGEFDKVKRAYLEHQKSIYDKLVDIMASRTTAHVKSMRLIDWSKEKEGVNLYMEILTKETSTLHRVLSKHLNQDTVSKIMQSVLENYKEQWAMAFGEVALVSEKARQRMLRDVEFFKTKIGNLDNASDVGNFLVNLVNEKEVILMSFQTSSTVSSAIPGLTKSTGQPIFAEKTDTENNDESKAEDKAKEMQITAR
ncbi:Vacuolar protein sorting-associated protein 54 [Golovinomyces cichoracearum]|uniref:Vacuolar protein sorting-associated protein 54 n=1 Tax=Golovinomyces cichoracearum TaxID=62708 RepID=A0A420H9I3_9PEZI|nr:Vacuolar protein sorting-associated protein 54 [Golovinomyces cichoracearum]